MRVDDKPDHIVLFDGVCNLCTRSVQFILRHDKREVFTFASIQSERGQALLLKHHLPLDEIDSFVLISHSSVYIEGDAAHEVARRFGGIWRALVLFYIFPKAVRDGVYRFVASRRFKWFGRRDTCFMPSTKFNRRFLS
jgi:predicted DCC family thiol-disulfide oxidoreductase YuxK